MDAPPAKRRSSLLTLFSDLLVFLIAVGVTLLLARWYMTARAQLIPAIVLPTTDFAAASNPHPLTVIHRMYDVASLKLGLIKPEHPKAVAFTFDDGPYPLFTPALLDLLGRQSIKATFFIEGRNSQMQPELLRRIVMDGHELGNHSYTHASFQDLDEAGVRTELEETDRLIRGVTGVRTRIMRPPGGRLDAARLRLVQEMGYTVVLDNVNPGDWRETDPLQIYSYTLWRSSNRAIVLLHSGRTGTIRALPTMIEAYRKKGYQFVTVSELARLRNIDIPGAID